MILADKIIALRRRRGWSQEELADRIGVSRQAVSKWESSQSIPDIEKILQLSELFEVSTDYLLKDEAGEERTAEEAESTPERRISVDEANAYLSQRWRDSVKIALATLLCILSPVTLIVLGALSEQPHAPVSDTAAGVIGLTVLFALVICAVSLFVYCGFKNQPYEFLDKSVPFVLERGASEAVTERQNGFRTLYVRCNIIATGLCIFSPVPLIVSAFFNNEMLIVLMLALAMLTVGIGVGIFVTVGVRNGSMQRLLRQGDYTEEKKKHSGLRETMGFAYWGVITVIFLLWSELGNGWQLSWIVYVIGAVLFPIALRICDHISDRRGR